MIESVAISWRRLPKCVGLDLEIMALFLLVHVSMYI